MKIMVSVSASRNAITQLEELIKKASDRYYNKGKFLVVDISEVYPQAYALLVKRIDVLRGKHTINDALFDDLWDVLKAEKPDSPVLKKTGAEPPKRGKVKLEYYMGSLDKVNPSTAGDWLRRHKGPYVVSDKLDGNSLFVRYRKSEQTRAYTKGKSDVGNDVSFLVPHLRLPELNTDLAIRAETIMKSASFVKYSKTSGGKYENARNMVTGLTNPNRREVHDAIKDIDVVAYTVFSPQMKPSAQLSLLKKKGFNVAHYQVFDELTVPQLSKLLAERKKKSKYDIDGLVVMQDRSVPPREDANPEHAVAYKETTADDIVQTKVTQIVWTPSKHNYSKPRVNIEPVRLSGVTINFASGHNAYFIANGFRYKDRHKGLPVRPLGPGAVVMVSRRGEVIPHIESVVKGVKKPSFPSGDYTWSKNGTDIILSEKTLTSDVKRITYFFSKIGVDGLKAGIVSKLHADGLTGILKIAKAPKSRFLKVEGIQEKTAAKLRQNIDKALTNISLPKLMDASGMFGRSMGEKRLAPLVKANPSIMSKEYSKSDLIRIAKSTPGFNQLAVQFADGFPKFKRFYEKLGVKAVVDKTVKKTGSSLNGQVVVFTGFRNADLEKVIEKNGGELGSGVNSKTTILLVKDKSSGSSKVEKARKLGLKIMTAAEFTAKFKL